MKLDRGLGTRQPNTPRSQLPAAVAILLASVMASPAFSDWKAATTAFEAGEFRTAQTLLLEVVELHPEYAPGHHLLGRTYHKLDQVEKAVDHLERAVRLEADRGDYRLRLAQVLVAAEDFDRAFAVLLPIEIGELEPDFLPSYDSLLAKAALGHGDPLVVLAPMRARADERSGSSLLHQVVASLHQRLGEPVKAFDRYKRAFEADPDPAVAERAIGVATREAAAAAPDQRAPWLRRAAAAAEVSLANRENAALRGRAARYRYDSGDFEQAERHYRALLELASLEAPGQRAEILFRLGRCAIKRQDLPRAVETLQPAVELSGSDTELGQKIHESLAFAHHRLGDYDLAVESYRAAGNSEKADAIEEALASQAEDRARRKECSELLTRVEKMREDASALRGTADWKELEKRIDKRLSPCQPYLEG